jgi:hypothetical protein
MGTMLEVPLSTEPRIEGASFVCEAVGHFTRVVDFGLALEDVVSGAVAIPPWGARFDVHFEGFVRGPRIEGAMAGTDFLLIRADGRSELHIHGTITTPDGARIAFFNLAGGTGDAGPSRVMEIVALHSNAPAYSWVNGLAAWGFMTIDAAAGEMGGRIYSL